MSRLPSSPRVRSARYSPTSRPRTRSTSPRHALGEKGKLELSLDDASQDTQLSTPQSTTSEPPTCTSTTLAQSAHHDPCSKELSGGKSTPAVPSARLPGLPRRETSQARTHPTARDGSTKIYHLGFEYTRAKVSSVKISYRCSFYRKPKLCPPTLFFYADSM
ncbi:hypothetical protein F443_16635, partial [Phytophthora nicotianae P1569]